jgi:hypothetical protein
LQDKEEFFPIKDKETFNILIAQAQLLSIYRFGFAKLQEENVKDLIIKASKLLASIKRLEYSIEDGKNELIR